MKKISYQAFSTLEVVFFFAIGILGRRLLDAWLSQQDLTGFTTLIKIAAVLAIIGAAVFVHTRLSKFLIARGWMNEER